MIRKMFEAKKNKVSGQSGMLHAKEFRGVYRPTVIILTVKYRWPTSDELGMQKTRRACGNRMEYVHWEDWAGSGLCIELGHSGWK
jgi:hypothetical protein